MKNLKIVHLSDTHGAKYHTQVEVPKCDVLIHSGDIGGRTNIEELTSFLKWFDKQPGDLKIFVYGNHDIICDTKFLNSLVDSEIISIEVKNNLIEMREEVLAKYPSIKILNNKDYVYEGIKFYGSPITPSFHRANWAFNADRGEEISKYWGRIPSDTNVLITHGPPYGILDTIPVEFKKTYDEDIHRGCEDLLQVIKKRLLNLKLHCFGHLHNSYGVLNEPVSNSRNVLFSNGSVINEYYELVGKKPLIITI